MCNILIQKMKRWREELLNKKWTYMKEKLLRKLLTGKKVKELRTLGVLLHIGSNVNGKMI